jgi:hypothetical protein
MSLEIAPPAEVLSSAGTNQYHLTGSTGTDWVPLDASLNVSLSATTTHNALLGANADLWTSDAGYNQDLAVFVSDNGGPASRIGWKESGGYGGTFSPNAAFLQIAYGVTAGHSYVFSLWWKSNRPAPGKSIYGGAGPIAGAFSPTGITVQANQ